MMEEKLINVLTNLQCELVAERSLVNPKEITWTQYDILTALQIQSSLPSKLSASLGLSRSKLSKNLVNLRKMMYIKQYPDKIDHRELITSLTPKGEDLLNNIDAGHNYLAKIAQKVFSEEEQQQFIALSQKLVTTLRKERIKNE
ncbi:transcriptional regulator [Liquorilactobacillus sucicola DSM 21376 = JCM 15457]|nr:transcriptional regulator [Liquorilactobacillus sucicola DSM 21376 = JCM 15457]